MNVNVEDILAKKWVLPAAIGVGTAAAGFIGGYFLGRKRGNDEILDLIKASYLDNDTQEEDPQMALFTEEGEPIFWMKNVGGLTLSDAEAEARDKHPSNGVDVVEPQDPEESVSVLRAVADIPLKDILTSQEVEEELAPVTVNVFTNTEDPWDQTAEDLKRADGREMYILYYDEFINNESGYNQETVTYYRGDNIVADQADTPIYNYSGMMGELRFGYGSNDPSIVYIRNDAIHMEWEVVLHTGMFAVEALGLDVEHEYEEDDIKHSMVRKFRQE